MTDANLTFSRERHRLPRNKVKSVIDLGDVAEAARSEGKTVVLCHGVFDILHMGHVRHIEMARREGDVLIVTVTSDKYVNKGPGRPVFNDRLRAEMIASLEYVDFVGVNDDATARSLLDTIRPDIYVKGGDYKDVGEDVTGNIVAEREAVENYGGKLVLTDGITFSSSALINRYLSIYEPSQQSYLDDLREADTLDRVSAAIDKIEDLKILFVGDAIIDEYQYVEPLGKSAKENMIATLFREREVFAGGVFAAANHVGDFCRNVEIVTCLGDYDSYEDLVRDTLRDNIGLHVVYKSNAPTTRKVRFIDTGYSMKKMFELYHMEDQPIAGGEEDALLSLVVERAVEADVVVVTDFGHGLITPKIIAALAENAKFLAVNTQSNAANHGYNLVSKYLQADYVCVDGVEARLAVHDKYADIESVIRDRLPNIIDCPKAVITAGKHGCFTYDPERGVTKVPALTNTIVDTVGAGDAFFSMTAPLVAIGTPMDMVGFIGNAVGAIKVGIVGHRDSVQKAPLLKFITAILK